MDEKAGSIAAYRKRAAELRAEAETISNPYTSKTLVDLATNYETLARALEKKNRAIKDQDSN